MTPRFPIRAAALLSGVLLAGPGAAAQTAAPAVTFQPFVSGVTQVTTIAHAGDGSGRLFVTQQDGRVRVIAGGSSRAGACSRRYSWTCAP